MALFDDDNQDRTETASAFRREEFRKQGTVALSRDLAAVIGLLGIGVALTFSGNVMLTQFRLLAERFFRFSEFDLDKSSLLALRFPVLQSWGWMVLPAFATAFVMAILAGVAQVGLYVTWEPLTPDFERLNPMRGLGKMFSSQSLVEAFKAFLKLTIGGFVIYLFLKGQVPQLGIYFQKTIPEMTTMTAGSVGTLFFRLVFSLAIVGGLDYLFQRYQLEQQMKMTKQEVREEYKLREGYPLIKSRIRQIQRRMATRRMMDDVPKADVVVTNPTHFAVALKYDPQSMAAPRVTAKGADEVAKKIRELAKKHGVPLVENKPLARTLYRDIDIGHSIPRELYKAVAEVLAYVYRLKGMRAA